MLKLTIGKLEDVDEQYRGLYKQDGDSYVLNVDESDTLSRLRETKSKVDEFRQGAISDRKKREEAEAALAKFEGVDLDMYGKLQGLFKQVEDEREQQLLKDGKFEDVFTARTTKMREAHAADLKAKDEALEAAKQTAAKLRGSLGRLTIERELNNAINETGVRVRKSAMMDMLSRTHNTFTVDDDGKMIAKVNGEVVRGSSGDPLTMAEHVAALQGQASHLFESVGGGGGAEGSNGGARGRSSSGKIQVSRKDPTVYAKYHKEIGEGKVEFID